MVNNNRPQLNRIY